MKRIVLAVFAVAAGSAWAFTVGSTRDEVIAELGHPTAEMKRGGKHFLYYGSGAVELREGKVVSSDGAVKEYMTKRAQGLVQADGQWVTPEEKKDIEARKAEQAKLGPKVQIIANGGKEVSFESLIVPGKVTIVDFYADWCGPCRMVAPELEKLAAKNADIYVRKIDIVNWESDVAKQHNLSSIPNMRVFDRNGKPVGKPTHNLAAIVENARKALE